MEVIFLGTSGSMPTQRRGASAIAIKRGRELIFFDCGEGTQRRMVEARIGFRRRTRMFISHLHGDHVLGLPGLLQTMNLLQRERPLYVYGPQGLTEFIEAFSSVLGGPSFPLHVHEILSEGKIYEGPEYDVTAVRADHDDPTWCFILEEHPRPGRFHPEVAQAQRVPEGRLWHRLQHGEDVRLDNGTVVRSEDVVEPSRRGLKVAYSGDTRPSKAFTDVSECADLMIHEATFDDSLADKAEENAHSTSREAAEVAKAAGVKMLVLTHISSRYPDPGVLLEEARSIFPETMIAEDLMSLKLEP
ncbi:MAG: ribonuclease Z [Candidatus Bathyarchaeota archaeon]|nr:MAG: ribonuclease Z [Candidatus Bathyarchaeota archaeon]